MNLLIDGLVSLGAAGVAYGASYYSPAKLVGHRRLGHRRRAARGGELSTAEVISERAPSGGRSVRFSWGALQASSAIRASALSGVGAGISLFSASRHQHLIPGSYGFLSQIGPLWYIGLAVVLLGFIFASESSELSYAVPVILLIVVLVATPAICYGGPRYEWTAQHMGEVSWIQVNQRLEKHIDLYQSWAGFFSGIAWFSDIANIKNLTRVATWWPLWTSLGSTLAVREIARPLLPTRSRCWCAGTLFFLANTVGQSYFSPQDFTFMLALIVIALCVGRGGQRSPGRLLLIVLAGVALAISHPLTSYLLFAALVVLFAGGLVRRLWPALAVLIPALIWTGVHAPAIRKYFHASSVGNISGNVALPSSRYGPVQRSHAVLINDFAIALGLALLGLAALIVVLRRRQRSHWTLAVCALSPVGLVLVSSYGQEGLYRVVLFALPWLAILAADSTAWRIRWTQQARWARLAPIPILPLVFTYLVGLFGLDSAFVARPADMAAIRYFESTARSQSALMVVGGNSEPIRITAGYPLFRYEKGFVLAPAAGVLGRLNPGESEQLMTESFLHALKAPAYYALLSATAASYSSLYGIETKAEYGRLTTSFLQAETDWKTVYEGQGVILLKYRR